MKRSTAVPLSIVPALAALAACDSGAPKTISGVDPCLPQVYNQAQCETAVKHNGYYYGGMWYRHVYTMPAMFYYSGYNRHLSAGGRVRAISSAQYSPSFKSAPRSTVVRGGFGGIGGARGFRGG